MFWRQAEDFRQQGAEAPHLFCAAWAALSALTCSPSSILQIGVSVEHDFPHHWHTLANAYYGEGWSSIRSRRVGPSWRPQSSVPADEIHSDACIGPHVFYCYSSGRCYAQFPWEAGRSRMKTDTPTGSDP
jgi:hypothetical protein